LITGVWRCGEGESVDEVEGKFGGHVRIELGKINVGIVMVL
jgi:hypothetical protein